MKILRPEEVTPADMLLYRELSPDELKEAYALAKASFSADDLQRYTELDEGVPFAEVLAELEELQKKSEAESR